MEKRAITGSKLSDYEVQTKLGQGSFGIVYRVKRKVDGKIYVLKQIDTSKMSQMQRKEAVHEATILSQIESPFVVKYYDSFTDKSKINIIMEFCENGDIGIHLKKQMGRPLAEPKIWRFFVEMCLGIQYLHANKILHRDIKTINMFLTKDDRIKIGDLGVAKLLNQTANFAHTVVGTPYYLSPELCEEKPYNHKSDIWSLGCVLYELCTLKHPFEANNQGALILKIVRGKYNPIVSTYSKELSNMVDKCLCKDYRKRPSIQEILEEPIMVEKANYYGYSIKKQNDLKSNNNNNVNQHRSENVKAVQQNVANGKPPSSQQQQPPASNPQQIKEKQYYNQLAQGNGAGLKKQPVLAVVKEEPPKWKRDERPIAPQKQAEQQKPAGNNIVASYLDPAKRNMNPSPSQQQRDVLNKPKAVSPNDRLNNNKFDAKGHEKKHWEQNNNAAQQKRPLSQGQALKQANQGGGQQKPVQSQANIEALKQHQMVFQPPKEQLLNQQQLAVGYQQQLLQQQQAVKNQRVKQGAPQQLSRMAQMAQNRGQRILKAGDLGPLPITKPDIKLVRERPIDDADNNGAKSGAVLANKQKSVTSEEEKEVLNLPDSVNKKNQREKQTAKEMPEEIQRKQKAKEEEIIRNKKEALLRANRYIEEMSKDSASNGGVRQVQQSDNKLGGGRNTPKEDLSTQQTSVDEEQLVPVQQKHLDDSEFDDLLNADVVQPCWKVGKNGKESGKTNGNKYSADRHTEFIPTYEHDIDDENEVDLQVYQARNSPRARDNKKMTTIKESNDDGIGSDSDTAYFNEDEINNRSEFDSEEEKDFQNRKEQLYDDDDEDHRPYEDNDDDDDGYYDPEQEKIRYREEFGTDEDEEQDNEDENEEDGRSGQKLDQNDRLSVSVKQDKIKQLNKEISNEKRRQKELEMQIARKKQQCIEVCGPELYKQCFDLYSKCANSDENDETTSEIIDEFLFDKNINDKQFILRDGLIKIYCMHEQYVGVESSLQSLSQELVEIDQSLF